MRLDPARLTDLIYTTRVERRTTNLLLRNKSGIFELVYMLCRTKKSAVSMFPLGQATEWDPGPRGIRGLIQSIGVLQGLWSLPMSLMTMYVFLGPSSPASARDLRRGSR